MDKKTVIKEYQNCARRLAQELNRIREEMSDFGYTPTKDAWDYHCKAYNALAELACVSNPVENKKKEVDMVCDACNNPVEKDVICTWCLNQEITPYNT